MSFHDLTLGELERRAVQGPRDFGARCLFTARFWRAHPELDPGGHALRGELDAARRAYATAGRVVRATAAAHAAAYGDFARALLLLDGRTAP